MIVKKKKTKDNFLIQKTDYYLSLHPEIQFHIQNSFILHTSSKYNIYKYQFFDVY